MYCTFCGKQIADKDLFCPHCGKPIPQRDAFAQLVAAARIGDKSAISALYEQTYSKVYYTVKSMIKDEDAVFDIVQDTYIKAFDHLDSFKGDTKFLPWIQQIAANTARDWLKKKRPMLFAQLNADDGQDITVEELIPEARSENIPDQFIDQEETKRLLHEIIEELPEDQRAVIGMFYYEEMSVKEIAAAMGVSESAVKSRLLYGRNKIETKVRELEKQGTKLYSLAPIPFLLLLFRNQKAYAAEVPEGRILNNVLASQSANAAQTASAAQNTSTTGAATAVGTTVAAGTAAAAASGGIGALKIGLIAFAAVAAFGAGAFGAVQIATRIAEPQEELIVEDTVEPEETEATEETETVEETEVAEETETVEETEIEPTPVDEALEQYRMIISQADSYDYGEYAKVDRSWLELDGYRYALVQMHPNDLVPTLLLKKDIMDTQLHVPNGYVRIFQYDPETKTLHQPAEIITDGGIRGGLSMSGDGNGILDTEWSGGTGEGFVTRTTLDGDSLNKETSWSGRIDQMPDSITFIEIEWHESSDLTALDDGTAPTEQANSDALPTDGDRIVLTGTVDTYNYDEIVALQGCPDPNAIDEYYMKSARSETYHVIVLDTPQTLGLYSMDSEGESYWVNEASMINLYYAEGMEQYDGQHITFSIDPHNTHWPSDTGLPLGQPYTADIHVLD